MLIMKYTQIYKKNNLFQKIKCYLLLKNDISNFLRALSIWSFSDMFCILHKDISLTYTPNPTNATKLSILT